jgi:hypothetical protein
MQEAYLYTYGLFALLWAIFFYSIFGKSMKLRGFRRIEESREDVSYDPN